MSRNIKWLIFGCSRFFRVEHSEHFPLKFNMLLFFIWHIPLNVFKNNWGLLIASTEGYTKTLINNLGSYSIFPFKHAVNSDVPAPQLLLSNCGVDKSSVHVMKYWMDYSKCTYYNICIKCLPSKEDYPSHLFVCLFVCLFESY